MVGDRACGDRSRLNWRRATPRNSSLQDVDDVLKGIMLAVTQAGEPERQWFFDGRRHNAQGISKDKSYHSCFPS